MLRGIRNRLFGDRGERLAEKHLRRLGMKLVARQWRGPSGEVDLIMRDGHAYVFVEVKTRRAVVGSRPEEAVTRDKQRTLLRLANEWAALRARRGEDRDAIAVRFDIVAVVWPEGGEPEVKHIRGAYEAS